MGPLTCSLSFNKHSEKSEKLLFFMIYRGIPILLGLMVVVSAYCKTLFSLRTVPQHFFNRNDFRAKQLLWYPIVFILTYVPYLSFDMRRIYYIEENNSVFWVLILVFSHPLGFYNALLFVIQRKMYKKVHILEDTNDDDDKELIDDDDYERYDSFEDD